MSGILRGIWQDADNNFYEQILFVSDEATFKLNGWINRHSRVIGPSRYDTLGIKSNPRVTVWSGGVIGF